MNIGHPTGLACPLCGTEMTQSPNGMSSGYMKCQECWTDIIIADRNLGTNFPKHHLRCPLCDNRTVQGEKGETKCTHCDFKVYYTEVEELKVIPGSSNR